MITKVDIETHNQFYVELGPLTKVATDPASKSKVVSMPFEFPDGTDGVLIICKLSPVKWDAHKEIANININFK